MHMKSDNLRARPDLSPIFGLMRPEAQCRIMDELLRIDNRLKALAHEAGEHVGVPYEHAGLVLFRGGQHSEISGGPAGHAGDIWFEVGFTFDESLKKWRVPPWELDSRIIIFCADFDTKAHAHSCTHDLVRLRAETDTPAATVQALSAHVDALAAEMRKLKSAIFTESLHAELVAEERRR